MNAIANWLDENGISAAGRELPARADDFVCDSRMAGPGAVFAALAGNRANGAAFASEAVARGAVLVLAETPVACGVPVFVVPGLREKLPALATSFYGHPSRKLRVAGVTGTNGKTTTTYLIEAMCEGAGLASGLVGTISYRYGGETFAAPNTTPDAVTLQRLLARMQAAGTQTVAMEVSSHGLQEHRVDGTAFDVAVFTNLTRDHLDYHADMEQYYSAKRRLFTELLPQSPKNVRAVINADDPYGARLASEVAVPVWTVGQGDADFKIERVEMRPAGFTAAVRSPFGSHEVHCKLPGLHNVYNATEALAAALSLGASAAESLAALAALSGVPGRLEHLEFGGTHAYVDYAHTDDALANVLRALRPVTAGRLITVFGCGGDRDRGKRPAMGRVAAEMSDVVVITSDNPRTEDPRAILADIEPGVQAGLDRFDGERGYHIEIDRRLAIAWAAGAARPGDVILVAGKGHEDYQIIGAQKFPFDDRMELRQAFAARDEVRK